MPAPRETATTFALAYLARYPDREMRIADILEGCRDRYSAANMMQSLNRLHEEGKVVRLKEGRSIWWAIALGG